MKTLILDSLNLRFRMARPNMSQAGLKSANRRRFVKAVGAVGISGLAAGCMGGGGSGGGSGTPTGAPQTSTEVPWSELSHEEWRERKAELAGEELEGGEQLVYATGIDDPEVIDDRINAFADEFDPLPDEPIRIDNSQPSGIRQRYAREAAAGRVTMDVIDLPMINLILDGVPVSPLDHIPSFQSAPDFAKHENLLGAIGFEARNVTYNSDRVDTPPETFDDLFGEEFGDGEIIMDYTPSQLASGIAMEKFGQDRIRALAEQQQPTLVKSGREVGEATALGNHKIAFLTPAHYALEYQAQGEPLEVVPGTELWMWRMSNIAKLYEPPHPHAADLFVDLFMDINRPELQAIRPGVLALDQSTIEPPSFGDHFDGEVWTLADISIPPNDINPTYQDLINAPVVEN